MDITDLRKEIDAIDDDLIKLLEERFDIVMEVKAYKQANNLPVLDSSREALIYDKIDQASSEYTEEIKHIYKMILHESRTLQQD